MAKDTYLEDQVLSGKLSVVDFCVQKVGGTG